MLKRGIVSVVLGILITWIFLFLLALILNGDEVINIISTITIVSTMIFCTYTIVDEIRKLKE